MAGSPRAQYRIQPCQGRSGVVSDIRRHSRRCLYLLMVPECAWQLTLFRHPAHRLPLTGAIDLVLVFRHVEVAEHGDRRRFRLRQQFSIQQKPGLSIQLNPTQPGHGLSCPSTCYMWQSHRSSNTYNSGKVSLIKQVRTITRKRKLSRQGYLARGTLVHHSAHLTPHESGDRRSFCVPRPGTRYRR